MSSPSPHFALPAHLSVPHCSHPCLAHGSLHCPAKTGRVGCFHLPDYASFSALFISQAPVLRPEMRGVVSVSDSPQQPISGSLPPLRVPSPWHEMNHPPTAPVSLVLQQQLLGCFPPVSQAGIQQRAAAFWRAKQHTKSRGSVQQRLRHREGKFNTSLFWGSTSLHSHRSFLLTEAFSTPSVLSVYVHLLPN